MEEWTSNRGKLSVEGEWDTVHPWRSVARLFDCFLDILGRGHSQMRSEETPAVFLKVLVGVPFTGSSCPGFAPGNLQDLCHCERVGRQLPVLVGQPLEVVSFGREEKPSFFKEVWFSVGMWVGAVVGGLLGVLRKKCVEV